MKPVNGTFTSASLVVCLLSISMNTHAAESAVLDEVVVTAQKREQSLQDVGISISALSGDQINALGLNDTREISQQIPGLQVFTPSPAFTIFNLRGVAQNNFTDNLEAPVAVYFDDVYVGSMNAIGSQMFDMERLEVLRGPQGTLFGRNATGGLIHFLSKKATEEELNGYVQAEVSEFNSYNFEGAVGGALNENVRGRLAARWEQSDGYVESGPILPGALGPGSPAIGGNGSDYLGADSYAIRGNLQIDTGDNATLDLTAAYSKDNDSPGVGAYAIYLVGLDANGLGLPIDDASNPLTGDVHRHAGSDVSIGGEDTGLDRDTTSLTAKFATQLSDNLEFVSITNWLDMSKDNREDSGAGLVFFPFSVAADYTQWSQEFRLSGENERYRWQVGAYYLDMDVDSVFSVGGPLVTSSTDGFVETFTQQTSTNWSIFGQVEYDLNETFVLIAGYRWSQDDKNIDLNTVATTGLPGVPAGTVLFDLDNEAVGAFADVPEIDYGDFAARLQLNWQVNDDVLAFLSYNRGIKGGNWSASQDVSIQNFRHNEETLHAYELGIKSTFADGSARLNATLFYYDYEDYQAFSLSNLIPQVANSNATNQGGEIELFLTPSENLDVILGASFIDSEIDQAPGAQPGSIIEDADLPLAPGYSINYLLRYNWDALEGNIAVQLDGLFNDEHFMEGHNGGASIQESYLTVNASIKYVPVTGNWDLRAWAKNLNDEEWAIYSIDIGGFVQRIYAPPRHFGLTASYYW